MKTIPPIEALMNPVVHSYEASLTVEEMLQIIETKAYRHIPVKENGRLIGVISESDLLLAEKGISLGLLCNRSVSIVNIGRRSDEVLEFMWRDRVESVLIENDGHLAGIFTVADACYEFSEFLRHQLLEEPLPYIIS